MLFAVLICILATARISNPVIFAGPNLAANQLIVYEPHGPGSGYTGLGGQLTQPELHALQTSVNALAGSFHAQFVLALDSAGRPGPSVSDDPACDGPTSPVRAGLVISQRATLWQAVTKNNNIVRERPVGRAAPGQTP